MIKCIWPDGPLSPGEFIRRIPKACRSGIYVIPDGGPRGHGRFGTSIHQMLGSVESTRPGTDVPGWGVKTKAIGDGTGRRMDDSLTGISRLPDDPGTSAAAIELLGGLRRDGKIGTSDTFRGWSKLFRRAVIDARRLRLLPARPDIPEIAWNRWALESHAEECLRNMLLLRFRRDGDEFRIVRATVFRSFRPAEFVEAIRGGAVYICANICTEKSHSFGFKFNIPDLSLFWERHEDIYGPIRTRTQARRLLELVEDD